MHLEFCKADVDTVKIGGEGAKEEKRNEAQGNLAEDVILGANVKLQ